MSCSPARLVAMAVVGLALVLQVSLFPHFAWQGVVPNLCLLVVVGAALTRGAQFAAVLGFLAGVVLDLAPPADHVAGRWALALVVVGYVAGRVRQDVKPTAVAVVSTVAALVVHRHLDLRAHRTDPAGPGHSTFGELLQVILVAVLWDVLLTPFVLPPVMTHVQPPRTGAGDGLMASSTHRPRGDAVAEGRLRLIVIQALVFSLFATLFARLYYLQVVSGDEYHAQAASQSVREIVVQPQRGLIVDDHGPPAGHQPPVVGDLGRPDHARQDGRGPAARGWSRSGWACSIDLPTRRSASGSSPAATTAASPGSAGTARRTSRSRSRATSGEPVALRILEQPEDFPAVLAEQETVRAYPRPFGVNLAHVLGYLSPITEDEYDDRRQTNGDRSVNGASSVGRAGVEKQYDAWLRGMPGYRSVAVDSMGRVLGDDSELAGQPGDTLVTSIDAKVQGAVEQHARTRRS